MLRVLRSTPHAHRLLSLVPPAVPAASVLVAARPLAHTLPRMAPSDVDSKLADDIASIISSDRLVLFLTGTPEKPQCRFTVQMVDLLAQLGVKYSFFNIMDDDEVCEGLKVYSDWPTYPQIYVEGELLGGYDICKDMMLDGSLVKLFKEKKLL